MKKNIDQKYIIGMDGGGTKTHAVITTSAGIIVAEHRAGPSNFQIIGVEKAAATIFQLITKCRKSAGCTSDQIDAVVCGLTGAGRIGDQQRMAKGLMKYARSKKIVLKKIIIESDARIALEGAFNGEPGIILIAGTGSIAFGKDSIGNVHRVGGWGRVLGDEGSGFSIGRQGLTAVTQHLDGRALRTTLTSMIAKKFKLSDQTAIINAVYKNGFDIASVAPLVLDAAEKKDRVCMGIVGKAVLDLAAHIFIASIKINATRQGKSRKKIPVAFIGGLITQKTIVRKHLSDYVGSTIRGVTITSPRSSPAYGAVILAMK